MWKLRIGVLVTSGLMALGLSSSAWADQGGHSDGGDVWLDNVGQPAGPGHEMDPHLACQDIDLWGSGLADGSGTFAINGWSPSGSQEVDYSGTWSSAGEEPIAVISVAKLISQVEANGDSAAAQGFHFKLDFSQDPQKHKTFWIDCPPSSSGGGGGTPSGGGGGTPPGGGSGTPSGGGGSTTTTSGTVSTPAVTSTSGPVKTSIGGVSIARTKPLTHKRHRKLVHPARHRKSRRRHVKAVTVAAPPFTG